MVREMKLCCKLPDGLYLEGVFSRSVIPNAIPFPNFKGTIFINEPIIHSKRFSLNMKRVEL